MTRRYPYSPGDDIKAEDHNQDFDGLATGENDYDYNSLQVFRSEAFDPFFKEGGCIWTATSGRNGTMSSGYLYIGGSRISVAGVSSYQFSANQATYIDIKPDGTPNYTAQSLTADAPAVSSGRARVAVVFTNDTAIIDILSNGEDSIGQYVRNTSALARFKPPVGSIMLWTNSAPPAGYLHCGGGAISRYKWQRLFKLFGTKYGAGDGSTTFNLPNFNGRVAVGADSTQAEFSDYGVSGGAKAHTLSWNEMPQHTHGVSDPTHQHAVKLEYGVELEGQNNSLVRSPPGANYNQVTYRGSVGPSYGTIAGSQTGISLGVAGANAPHNNLQPYITVSYIIKGS